MPRLRGARRKTIDKIVRDLTDEGAKCEVFVNGVLTEKGVDYSFDRIEVTFPNGRRWDIIEIQEDSHNGR